MLEIVVNPDMTVKIPLVGTFYTYQGETVEILSTRTFQEKVEESFIPRFTTIADIIRVSDEGDYLDTPVIPVRSDELTEI